MSCTAACKFAWPEFMEEPRRVLYCECPGCGLPKQYVTGYENNPYTNERKPVKMWVCRPCIEAFPRPVYRNAKVFAP